MKAGMKKEILTESKAWRILKEGIFWRKVFEAGRNYRDKEEKKEELKEWRENRKEVNEEDGSNQLKEVGRRKEKKKIQRRNEDGTEERNELKEDAEERKME